MDALQKPLEVAEQVNDNRDTSDQPASHKTAVS